MEQYSDLIVKAIDYIKTQDAEETMTVDAVARHAGFSSDHFNRIFAAYTGFTIMEYVRFIRLRRGADRLRGSEDSVLAIALDCGYDTSESFSRAFKKQYGRAPAEYRELMQRAPDNRLGSRLTKEFPTFQLADTGTAVDWLLEQDAAANRRMAHAIQSLSGAVLYDGDDLSQGFVWIFERRDRYYTYLFAADYDTVARYCELFGDKRFALWLHNSDDMHTVATELKQRQVVFDAIKQYPQTMYRKEHHHASAPEGIALRELCYADLDVMADFYRTTAPALSEEELTALRHRFYQRDVAGEDGDGVFRCGLFHGNELIGIGCGDLLSVRGLVFNDSITVNRLRQEFRTEEVYRFIFKAMTDLALDKGALPFDSIQCNPNVPEHGRFSKKYGNFNSLDLGYEVAAYDYQLLR